MVFCVAICQPELQYPKEVFIFRANGRVNGWELRESYLDGKRRDQRLKLEFHHQHLEILFIGFLEGTRAPY